MSTRPVFLCFSSFPLVFILNSLASMLKTTDRILLDYKSFPLFSYFSFFLFSFCFLFSCPSSSIPTLGTRLVQPPISVKKYGHRDFSSCSFGETLAPISGFSGEKYYRQDRQNRQDRQIWHFTHIPYDLWLYGFQRKKQDGWGPGWGIPIIVTTIRAHAHMYNTLTKTQIFSWKAKIIVELYFLIVTKYQICGGWGITFGCESISQYWNMQVSAQPTFYDFWYLIYLYFVFDQERKGSKIFSVFKKLFLEAMEWSIPRTSYLHQNLPPWAGNSMWIGARAWQHLHFLAHQDGYSLFNGHYRNTKRNL